MPPFVPTESEANSARTSPPDISSVLLDQVLAAGRWRPNVQSAPKPPEVLHQTKQPDGSVVDVIGQSNAVKVVRPDKSSVEKKGTNGIIETNAAGKQTRWDKDAGADRWRSIDYVGAQRIGYKINTDGTTQYSDIWGTKYTTNTDLSQKRERANGTVALLNSQGFVIDVSRPDKTGASCNMNGNVLVDITERTATGKTVWTQHPDGTFTAPGIDEVRSRFRVGEDGRESYVSSRNGEVFHTEQSDGNSRDFIRDKNIVGDNLTQVDEHLNGKLLTWKRQGMTDTWECSQTKEQRKNVSVDTEGTYSFVDADGYKHVYTFNDLEDRILSTNLTRPKAVETARDNVITAVTPHMDAATLKNFTDDLDLFENHAQIRKLSEKERVNTYNELEKLISSIPNNSTLDQALRLKLAKETAHHLANPRTISQGFHETCGATTAEVVGVKKDPSTFVNIVRQIADTGSFKTTVGNTIKLDKGTLVPDWEAKNYDPYGTNTYNRSFASQLYQTIGINAAYTIAGANKSYQQRSLPTSPTDTGERVIYSGGSSGSFNGLTFDEVQQISKETLGHGVTLLHRGTDFSNVAQLETKLRDLKKNDAFPVIMHVHTKNEPFYSANGSGRSGSAGGGHYVTLWDIDSVGRVMVDNQGPRSSDYESLRRLTLQQVFDSDAP